MSARLSRRLLLALGMLLLLPSAMWAAAPAAKVYVILWFDTEDYILPADDDAALHLADFLTREGIRATFKVVGEKARELERRKRDDVIAALKKHEIGYHSNWHSVQPSPALYLSTLGWDEGVAEFDRREGPGRDDVERIFGRAPTCYGQPGSSWGPQSYGAMKKWGMGVYLDSGRHVGLDGKPCYYDGILNLYQLDHRPRTALTGPKEEQLAEDHFTDDRKALLAEGGGIVSIYYHPCEFVHKEFWDGVNFRNGANPPREQWKRPAQKSPEETKIAYDNFETWIRFMKRFPEVQFITASEAAKLYRDRARGRRFGSAELKIIASAVGDEISFQKYKGYTLSASEVFVLLNEYVAERAAGRTPGALEVKETPFGPTSASPAVADGTTTDWSQFGRTAADVADFVRKQHRVPGTVWLGSKPVSPEAYLRALALVALDLMDGKQPPETIEIKPTKLKAADYVSDDDPKKLWGWVIFPPGFRAPAMMKLAKRQAWTLKPAVLDPNPE
ncbi:MAG TPA: hypothetical protein DDY78_18520 [Planctomycetales bacterium]|nr:hypothetical protein [Planctomycetales bacterium]